MDTLLITSNDLSAAAAAIRGGELCAVPTETVYGLAANGLNAEAVAKIYAVKKRPAENRLSLLVPGFYAVCEICADIPESARELAETFWPGPLTMILKKQEHIPDIVVAGGETVGVRCPNHPKTLELLRLTGVPLAAPSANISGMKSPTSAEEVLRYFDGLIDCIIDGGECSIGVESTIVDLTAEPCRILRQGALSREEIEKVLGERICLLSE